MFKNGLKEDSKNYTKKNEVLVFEHGYLKLKGESLRVSDHPSTGLPC